MDTDAQKLLTEYLMRHAYGDQRIADLLWHSVGRVMLKDSSKFVEFPGVAQVFDVIEHENMVTHIVDWLRVAVTENARWLLKTDHQGRPKKLLKFGTLEAIHAEADHWMRRRLSSKAKALIDGDEVLHFELGDGWTMVRLLTPAALDRESSLMQHCVGHGSYDWSLSKDGALFLSLRDPHGMPHITLEIAGSDLLQFQGKQNVRPIAKYVMRCLPFFSATRLSYLPDDVIMDTHGVIYAIYDLPDILTVDGPLRIHNGTTGGMRLPSVIEATGSVTLSGKAFANVPTRITAGCDLCIHDSSLPRLPETLNVQRDISLVNSVISELPEGLMVHGQLFLRKSAITKLPRGLLVRRFLDIADTAIDQLPDDLRCGDIDISNTSIKRFDTSAFLDDQDPNRNRYLWANSSGLVEIVGTPHFRGLHLSKSRIKQLPQGLEVTEVLDISRSSISAITDEMKIGSLVASGCDLRIDLDRINGPVDLKGSSVSMVDEFSSPSVIDLDGASIRGARRIEATVINFADGPITDATLVASCVSFRNRTEPNIDAKIVARSIEVRPNVSFLGEGIFVERVYFGHLFIESLSLPEARELLLKEGSFRPRAPDGVTIICGPTGSGKSNLLSSILERMGQGPRRNIVTIEEPPEFAFPEMRIDRPYVHRVP
jgi:hypothetical protein